MIRLEAVRLRCENRVKPYGVEKQTPKLSWLLSSARRGEQQTAYQILVASSLDQLSEYEADYWNSGRVDSAETVGIPYGGKPLPSMASCYWTVRVWGRDGRESNWSEPSRWVMGVLNGREWMADWIGAISDEDARLPAGRNFHLHRIDGSEKDPWSRVDELAKASIILRKDIFVSNDLERATVFICGLGAFQMSINGVSVSDHFLEPAWTDYDQHCPYLTYDVTASLLAGDNVVSVLLGNSMYNVAGGKGRYTKFLGSFGPPKMILQMCLEYDDGRREWFLSDNTWLWKKSPITFNCIFGGEDYDARLEQTVSKPNDVNGCWQPAKRVAPPKGRLISESIAPRKVRQVYEPEMITEPCEGIVVVDLGQNIAGRMKIKVSGDCGQKVRMVPGELLDNRGYVIQKNMTSGQNHWTTEFNYILKGDGEEIWNPDFSYTGFRYVQVEGVSLTQQEDRVHLHELIGEAIHLDAAEAGTFDCSNSDLLKIYDLIHQATRSNLQSVATDCPHREKLGWIEQAYLMGPALVYQYDLQNYFRKLMGDIRDAQQVDGLVPDIAPEYVIFNDGFRDSPEWGAASVVVPWLMYLYYGDVDALKENFDCMTRYAEYLRSKSDHWIVTHGLGDWYDVGPAPFGVSQLTSPGVTGTVILYEITKVLAKTARIIGNEQAAIAFEKNAVEIKTAFNQRFLFEDGGIYDKGSQTACAMPLVNGMVPEESIEKIATHLVKDVEDHQYQITAGDVGHVYVLRALSAIGADDVVMKSVSRTDTSGYLYQVAMGASTLTEAWNASPDSSQNHLMLGHALEWFYTGLAGICFDERFPQKHQVMIHPKPVEGVDWVSASYQTIFGKLEVSWVITEAQFSLDLKVPMSMTAIVYLPTESPRYVKESGISIYEISGMKFLGIENGKCVFEVPAGNYEITAPVI